MSSKLRVSLFALSMSAAICALPVTASSEEQEFDNQWGLAAIHLNKALEKGITGEGVGVAIVDSAFQAGHPEF